MPHFFLFAIVEITSNDNTVTVGLDPFIDVKEEERRRQDLIIFCLAHEKLSTTNYNYSTALAAIIDL